MITVLHIHSTVGRWCSCFLWGWLHNIGTLNLRGPTDRYTRATTTCKRRNVPFSFLFSVGRDELRPRTRHPSICAGVQWSTNPWWGGSFGLEAAWRHSSKWLKRAINIWPSGKRNIYLVIQQNCYKLSCAMFTKSKQNIFYVKRRRGSTDLADRPWSWFSSFEKESYFPRWCGS